MDSTRGKQIFNYAPIDVLKLFLDIFMGIFFRWIDIHHFSLFALIYRYLQVWGRGADQIPVKNTQNDRCDKRGRWNVNGIYK